MADIVLVFSLDFDGCLHHKHVKDDYITSNTKLIEHFKEKVQEQKILGNTVEVILTSFSNRQTISLDTDNSGSNATKSSFRVLKQFANHLKDLLAKDLITVKYDPISLQDIYLDKAAGECVNTYLENNLDENIVATDEVCNDLVNDDYAHKLFTDSSKIHILYLQCQHLASLKKCDVHVSVFDDRSDLLSNSYSYFSDNPTMLPKM